MANTKNLKYHSQGHFLQGSGAVTWQDLSPEGHRTKARAIAEAKRHGTQLGVRVRVIVRPVKRVVWTDGKTADHEDEYGRLRAE